MTDTLPLILTDGKALREFDETAHMTEAEIQGVKRNGVVAGDTLPLSPRNSQTGGAIFLVPLHRLSAPAAP